MINSMTGFGQGRGQNKYARVDVEIKSLNHRFLETVVHLPEGYNSLESLLKKEIQKRLKRGRLTLNLNIIPVNKSQHVELNLNLAKRYLASINRLKKLLKFKGELSPERLISLPGVISLKEPWDIAPDKIIFLAQETTKAALNKLIVMRRREGESILRELISIITRMKKDLDFISARFNGIVQEKKTKLSNDDFSLFLKSQDVTEELARFKFHLYNLKAGILKTNGGRGKELDFISQELQREINTLGVKVPDMKISQKAVMIKADVDKIREQLQNVE